MAEIKIFDGKISIVIPSFNQVQFIERSLQSLKDQGDSNLEIIVMDGGSTDGSVEIIKKFEPMLAYWQSQKDNGQSAAINEGIRRSTGEFVTWFNTDDIILPNAIYNLRKMIAKYPQYRWFSGSMLWIDEDDKIIHAGKQEQTGKLFKSDYFISVGPSSFMRRDMLDEYGLIKEDFHFIMDLELWYRFVTHGEYMCRVPGYMWAFRVQKDSKTAGRFVENNEAALRREKKVAAERERLITMYPGKTIYQASSGLKLSYYLNKIFDRALPSHLLDRRFLNKKWYNLPKSAFK